MEHLLFKMGLLVDYKSSAEKQNWSLLFLYGVSHFCLSADYMPLPKHKEEKAEHLIYRCGRNRS